MPRAERGGARGVVAAAAAAPAGSTGTVETGLEAVGEEPRTRSFTIFVRAVNILTPKDVRGSSLQVWGSTTAELALQTVVIVFRPDHAESKKFQ
jgi:hypothetical protein